MKFKDKLKQIRACGEALDWVGGRGAQRAWDECERADWMLWLAARTLPRQTVILLACDCAATALKYTKGTPAEDPARTAIKTARAWVCGKASLDEVRTAADAAHAHAHAADDADDAADAAANAAAAAAYGAARSAAARHKAHVRMCRLIRRRQPKVPEVGR